MVLSPFAAKVPQLNPEELKLAPSQPATAADHVTVAVAVPAATSVDTNVTVGWGRTRSDMVLESEFAAVSVTVTVIVFVPSPPAPTALDPPDPLMMHAGLSVRLNPLPQDAERVKPVVSETETVITRSSAAVPAPSLKLETSESAIKSLAKASPIVAVSASPTTKVGASVSNADTCPTALRRKIAIERNQTVFRARFMVNITVTFISCSWQLTNLTPCSSNRYREKRASHRAQKLKPPPKFCQRQRTFGSATPKNRLGLQYRRNYWCTMA
jgi:hypothetical protein